MVCRRVCCRAGRSRAPPTRKSRAFSRRVRIAAGGKEFRPCGGELDRQGQAIEPPADRGDRRGIARGQPEGASSPPRPAARTVRPPGSVRAREMAAVGSGTANGGTGYSCSPYTRRTARLVTSTFRRADASSRSTISGRRGEHVLEVVEQHQRRRRNRQAHVLGQRLRHRSSAGVAQPHDVGQCRCNRAGIRQRRERKHAHAAFELVGQVSGGLKREAGLAAAPRSGERQQAYRVVPQQFLDALELLFPPDERGAGHRQPAGVLRDRASAWPRAGGVSRRQGWRRRHRGTRRGTPRHSVRSEYRSGPGRIGHPRRSSPSTWTVSALPAPERWCRCADRTTRRDRRLRHPTRIPSGRRRRRQPYVRRRT